MDPMPKRGKHGWKSSTGEYLVEIDTRDGFGLAWFIPEDDEIGGSLGDLSPSCEEDEIAHKVAIAHGGQLTRMEGFEWESHAAAKKARIAIERALLEYEGAKPWPEWAKTAQKHGWKPPKDWTP